MILSEVDVPIKSALVTAGSTPTITRFEMVTLETEPPISSCRIY